jgi:plastocyanin
MKPKLPLGLILILITVALSFIPVAPFTTQHAAAWSTCDWAQFVADVTVPDGTSFLPGATFKKTWRLKNIGTCTWSTSYALVFDTGEKMGAPTSVNLPSGVAPGQTVDISVDMTAPTAAGHYIGYWKFKNASGVLFGIGSTANKSFWVEINVSSSSGVNYDFAANLCSATWWNDASSLPCPGTDGSANGFALKLDNPVLENGMLALNPGILMAPQQQYNGMIYGVFPAMQVLTGDQFQATVGCQNGALSCYVRYVLQYKTQSGNVYTLWTWDEKYEGLSYNANVKLDSLAGQSVSFILGVRASGSATGDRALWVHPVIVRTGGIPPVTGTPPTPTSTPGPGTATATPLPPPTCDRAQFIADVTVPDGTVFNPGVTFAKTWRLKNVGTCTWTTSYALIFDSGDKMSGPDSVNLPNSVAPGQTVDLTINLTSPTVAGSYRGYWKFKNANGVPFGIGTAGTKSWWVDIKVAGATLTPTTTPSTPGTPVPSATPAAGTMYDFAANACSAAWFSSAGSLPCPGTDGDQKGFVLKVSNPRLENGTTDPRLGLLTFPQNVFNGYIQGIYPTYKVKAGDRFRSIVNCEFNATSCYVVFRLDYQTGTGPITTFWAFVEKYEGQYYQADIDLTPLVGQDVKFILTVLSTGSPTGDRALWVAPVIYNATGMSATPSSTPPATFTPTLTPTGASAGVSISNFSFQPQSLQVTVGTTITWTNNDTTSHTVTSDTGVFDSGTLAPGSTFKFTFTQAGTFAYHCNIHSTMKGTITVVAATPTPTATGTNTSNWNTYQDVKYGFSFKIPPGSIITSQSDNIGRVDLPFTLGTNLHEKYIDVKVVEGASTCKSPDIGLAMSSENVTINGIQFLKEVGMEGAAGNIYDTIGYSTIKGNACISLTLVLHSVNPGVYTTPPPLFDQTAESAVFFTIMSTYANQ